MLNLSKYFQHVGEVSWQVIKVEVNFSVLLQNLLDLQLIHIFQTGIYSKII